MKGSEKAHDSKVKSEDDEAARKVSQVEVFGMEDMSIGPLSGKRVCVTRPLNSVTLDMPATTSLIFCLRSTVLPL